MLLPVAGICFLVATSSTPTTDRTARAGRDVSSSTPSMGRISQGPEAGLRRPRPDRRVRLAVTHDGAKPFKVDHHSPGPEDRSSLDQAADPPRVGGLIQQERVTTCRASATQRPAR